MIGPILMVLALLIFIPLGVLITGGVLAALIGETTRRDRDAAYGDTEYIEISRSG